MVRRIQATENTSAYMPNIYVCPTFFNLGVIQQELSARNIWQKSRDCLEDYEEKCEFSILTQCSNKSCCYTLRSRGSLFTRLSNRVNFHFFTRLFLSTPDFFFVVF